MNKLMFLKMLHNSLRGCSLSEERYRRIVIFRKFVLSENRGPMSIFRGKDLDAVARCVQTYPQMPLAKSAEFFSATVLIPGPRGRHTCTDADSVQMKSCRENKRSRTNIYSSIT